MPSGQGTKLTSMPNRQPHFLHTSDNSHTCLLTYANPQEKPDLAVHGPPILSLPGGGPSVWWCRHCRLVLQTRLLSSQKPDFNQRGAGHCLRTALRAERRGSGCLEKQPWLGAGGLSPAWAPLFLSFFCNIDHLSLRTGQQGRKSFGGRRLHPFGGVSVW